MSNQDQPILIKRIKKAGGHHGGAWKVAYADFVTAMMALFIVLWLLNSDEKVKQAVSGYFRDPGGAGALTGSALAGDGPGVVVQPENMDQLKETLEQAMKQIPVFEQLKDQVEFTVTGEGLRIELLETERGAFFESGSAQPSKSGHDLLVALAAELGKLPNLLLIEGHTDAKPFSPDRTYSNWELSADRANAARRLMARSGLRPGQVKQVRGFADQNLRKTDAPLDPSNRRITVLVQYLVPPPAPSNVEPAPGDPDGGVAVAPPAH
jgi:chemotaxis protein MotB